MQIQKAWHPLCTAGIEVQGRFGASGPEINFLRVDFEASALGEEFNQRLAVSAVRSNLMEKFGLWVLRGKA